MEIIASRKNKLFLEAVKNAEIGDEIQEKFGVLKCILLAGNDEVTYEERLKPNVLFRRSYKNGKLFKKLNSTTFIFVDEADYNK